MDVEEEAKRSSVEKRSSSERRFSRRRNSRSNSRSRNRRYQRSPSKSLSPFRRTGFRGGNRRFQRRSPFRGGRNFRDHRFRRSRSTSRTRFDRKDRRRYEGRRSRSESPNRIDNYRHQQQQQQQQQQQMNYTNDPYNYMQNVVPPMNQFNSYDFQTNYPPPAPNFNIACPVPPGIHNDTWIQTNMAPNMPPSEESEEEKKKRDAAIAEEKKRQREDLKRQLDQYISRAEKMKRELKVLKDQKSDLLDGLGKRSPSPKTNGFIKENEKLQSQISSKLAEILDVIDMLNKIIKKDSDDEEANKKKQPSKRSRKSDSEDCSPERIKNELLESMKRKKQEAEECKKDKVNYVYYDPEIHWCKHCQVFPKTAKDYLSHLHSKDHLDKIANRSTEGPWRASFQKINEAQNYPDAPTEKVPIKGLQFFEPSLAWYCKLCEMFMGDSWCVSLHLKSDVHAQRYKKLIEREPKFEEKWLEARNKAYELSGGVINLDPAASNSSDKQNSESNKKASDKKINKKKKNKKDSKKKRKHGKKRKRGESSSSSSDSEDNSDSSSGSDSSSKKNDSDHADTKNSIRVAMRNILNKGSATENDERSGKWTMIPIDSNKPQVPPAPTISAHGAKENKKDEQIIGQWSTVEPIISQEEKRLLENLKGRLKTNQKHESTEKQQQQVVEKKEIVKEKEKERDRDRDRLRSRSRERNRNDRNYRGRKSRSKSKSRSRSPRNRNRDHRYRRRYSRSRSRSPKSSKYEKSSFNFPTEPKLPSLKDEKKLPSRSYNSSTKKDDSSSASASSLAKKMPFIGKMPVFKKQMIEKKIEEDQQDLVKKEDKTSDKQKFDEKAKNSNEKWEDLMPDPLQFSAMMNSASNQHVQQPPPISMRNDEIEIPPGLHPVSDYDEIPKPISDAPPLKTGPLPKDFQTTLDLLFDGDTPKTVIETPPIDIPQPEIMPIIQPTDGPQMILPEELSQHALLYGNFFPQSTNIQPVPPPPPTTEKLDADNNDDDDNDQNDSVEMIDEEPTEKFGKSQEDIDDLALLGIDVNDVGSGLW